MNVTRTLVALYPRPVRERWGPELEHEASSEGWRSWPGLMVTLLGLWIHPAVWPAESAARRRARVANLAVAVTGAGWLTGHALLELTASVPRGLAHSWILDLCDTTTFIGFVLVLPLPRRTTWISLLTMAIRRLAVPVLLGTAVVLAVYRGTDSPRLLLLMCWWLALILGVIQSVRTVAAVESAAGSRRLRAGLWFAVLGLTLSAGVIVSATIASGNDIGAGIIAGCGLLALAVAGGGTVRDLSTAV